MADSSAIGSLLSAGEVAGAASAPRASLAKNDLAHANAYAAALAAGGAACLAGCVMGATVATDPARGVAHGLFIACAKTDEEAAPATASDTGFAGPGPYGLLAAEALERRLTGGGDRNKGAIRDSGDCALRAGITPASPRAAIGHGDLERDRSRNCRSDARACAASSATEAPALGTWNVACCIGTPGRHA